MTYCFPDVRKEGFFSVIAVAAFHAILLLIFSTLLLELYTGTGTGILRTHLAFLVAIWAEDNDCASLTALTVCALLPVVIVICHSVY
jgi:hypothetical protein